MGERSLTDLGRRVAARQDEARRGTRDRERGLSRLLEADRVARPARPVWRSRWVQLAAAAALVFVLAASFAPVGAPISFDVGNAGARRSGEIGAWIAAPEAADLPLHFSDGSLVLLGAGGRARVASSSRDGAEIALERGQLDLAIVHRDKTRWQVRVGPFLVHVVGTRFATTWNPETETFSVTLREGAITVDGPVVGEGRAVRAGERIEVATATRTLTVHEASTTQSALAAAGAEKPSREERSGEKPRADESEPEAPRTIASNVPRSMPAPSAAVVAPQPPAAASWRALAATAKYKEALAAAESEGFEAICASASAADLHALADASRFAGSASRAEQAFSALLDRFPGSDDASYAVFMEGRSAHQRGDYGGAARWLSRYLRERPGGRFAEEASGRLVEVSDRGGNAAGARAAAERYLAAYPSGPHAEYARRVLGRAP